MQKRFKNIAVLLIVVIGILTYGNCHAAEINIDKLLNPKWIRQETLRYSFLTSAVSQGILTGLVESHKYNGNHIVAADDYHVYRFGQDVSSIATGFLLYATVKNKEMTKWKKFKRILGVACLRRNSFELAYRANRVGDPFNYSETYSSNRKAIVLFKWDGDKGKLVDFYISGTGKQGAFLDLGFLLAGLWLFSD